MVQTQDVAQGTPVETRLAHRHGIPRSAGQLVWWGHPGPKSDGGNLLLPSPGEQFSDVFNKTPLKNP